MVRMRNSDPQASTPREPRFAVGTRVADPLEGRTGHIARVDAATSMYHLVYSDGFEQDLGEAEVEHVVVRAPPPETDENGTDPHDLIGVAVAKSIARYDGVETQCSGHVASYFAETKCYRVVFETSLCEDMSADAVKALVKRANPSSGSSDAATEPAAKKARTSDESSASPPLNTVPFPSRTAAYVIVRRVLRQILVQDGVKALGTDRQRLIIKNEDIKPKRALEQFVEADGLKVLRRVLHLWMKSADKLDAAMLVLKILAVLPGVTRESVMASGIGQTLSGIVRLSRSGDKVNPALGDLALWVTKSWWDHVNAKSVSLSAKDLVAQQTWREKASVLPPLVVEPLSARPEVKRRAAMTEQLRQAMAAQSAASADDDALPFFLPQYNSLGSVDMRRPRREIKMIESFVESVRRHQEDAGAEGQQDDANDDVDVQVGRLKFGRPDVINYSQAVAPIRLLATTRSKVLARQDGEKHDLDDEEDAATLLPRPNKLLAPTKSILKRAQATELPPLNAVRWE